MLSTPVTISNSTPPTSISNDNRSSTWAIDRNGGKTNNRGITDQAHARQRQTQLRGQRGGAVHPDRRPPKPRSDIVGRLQPHPARPDADGFAVELGHASAAAAQQLGRAAQYPAGVAAEAHVAVDQQDR